MSIAKPVRLLSPTIARRLAITRQRLSGPVATPDNAVYAEPDAPLDAEAGQAVAEAIAELETFLGAKEIEYGDQIPADWQQALRISM